jgi:hypothetical protein
VRERQRKYFLTNRLDGVTPIDEDGVPYSSDLPSALGRGGYGRDRRGRGRPRGGSGISRAWKYEESR